MAAHKAKNTEPEDDELAGLDEELAALEAATDLDDLEVDEPDDELEEDEEDAPKPAKRGKASKAKAEPEPDGEEDDAEDEEDEFDAMSRIGLKAYNYANDLGVSVKKSMSDDDLRAALREAADAQSVDQDDEDEDDDEEPAEPPKKPRGRPKGSTNKAPRKEPSEEPAFSADDVAAIGDVPEHQVRGFARKHPAAFPKASPKSQYRFNARQVRVLLKGLGVIKS